MAASGGSLPRYVGTRILLMIPVVWLLLTIVFLMLRVAPGDPVTASVGGRLPPEVIDQRREALGLNDPLLTQYWDYLSGVLQLDFGQAITDNEPILHVIADNGGATLTLTLAGLLVALVVGIPLGVVSARLRDRPVDVGLRFFGIVTYAAPVFFTGYLLQLWFVQSFGWPVTGDASPLVKADVPERTHIMLVDTVLTGNGEYVLDALQHLFLPALVLGLLICGVFIRLTRVNLLQTLQSDYVEAARARGVAESKVVRAHAFRNAMVPVVTVIGLQIALLMSGAILTESTFSWPGLGTKLVYYIENRDYAAVQGIITLFGVVVVLVNLVVDIVNALIDPRVRY